MANLLTDILRAASKHPNSRVSKLINTVEEDPSQKNIVLLLIELADHAEYSTDFNISLKYYLDLFESCGITSDLALNEAGLLLVNSSKIYSKRVDYVQSLVERQILTLSNADNEIQQQKLQQQEAAAESATPVEKPKRGRKRALEVPSDPYEVELVPKKLKKLTDEKRFAVQKTTTKPKLIQRNIEMEQHIHPAGWMHAAIYDLDNEEDVDTKRNYKLFTYHIEHRYNTLVPDINFRLHFKVKDYIDAQEEEMTDDEACNTDRTWPPLSEEYVKKYIKLENFILQQDIKATNGNYMAMEEDDKEISVKQNDTSVEGHLNDTVNQMEISVQNLNTSAVNESKNDSGLGQSLLDESNKNDNTLETTQLDATIPNEANLNNTTLESSTIVDNLNETNLAENDKTLNLTQTQQENDSALGTSILDSTNNTELNLTADISGNLNATTDNSLLDSTNLAADLSGSLNMTTDNVTTLNVTVTEVGENLDSTNCNENLNNTEAGGDIIEGNNTTENLNITEGPENKKLTENATNQTLENLETSKETEAEKTTENSEVNKTTENLENTDNLPTLKESEENVNVTESQENSQNKELKDSADTEMSNAEQLSKATETRKDSALSDDRHLSISTENLAISTENLAQHGKSTEDVSKCLEIDVIDNHGADPSQIRIHMPNTDDEGVYLSDLDENDMRMLSPSIRITNIFPGVLSKNITIHMDDELRQALELRDGIMEHFGRETYHVPVVTEPTKQKLVFNILKLPEKIIRKKILFKLGPDMDLYLKARCSKRSRCDPQPREYRTTKLLQWFSLNNTDMTGIIITPPNSPGHSSEFCGFSDNEDDDDAVSCSEFCGFTAEEQAALLIKNLNRLSRDSGVGVDGNQLTPDKEPLEIIFEETPADVENCKRNINFGENNTESTESILNELSSELRAALVAEMNEGTAENNTENLNETNNPETDKLATENSTETVIQEKNTLNNTEETVNLPNENSSELLDTPTIATEETDKVDTVSSMVIDTPNEQGTENILTLPDQDSSLKASEPTENLSELAINMETSAESLNIVSDDLNKDVEMSVDQLQNASVLNNIAENGMENKDCDKNNIDQNIILDDHHADNGDDSEDDTILDLDVQGVKTKIQQWHEHLQPILAKSRERHHFDVFKLGTEIIETVQTKVQSEEETISCSTSSSSNKHPVASFQDIMDDKDKSYVSRYFLSTLLLANQSNVEITIDNKSSENPTSWNDIQLKLLSTKRHTVAIEDNIGMISDKKKVLQKETNDKKAKVKTKEIKPTPMEVDEDEDDDDDEPLIRLQGPATTISNVKSKTATKRTSDTIISTIVDKKPKDTHLFTTPNSIVRPNESSSLVQITNVQILPPLPATTIHTASSSSYQLSSILDKPCTSRQAKELQALEVNLNSVRTLQPIEKVPRYSDDYDSGIFSTDELST